MLLVALCLAPQTAQASKFTHPTRAWVKVDRVKLAKISKSRAAGYQWTAPAVDGKCTFTGRVTEVTRKLDDWRMVDLKERLHRVRVPFVGPCTAGKRGSALVQLTFAPLYSEKSPRITGITASGVFVVRRETLLLRPSGPKATVGGATLALKEVEIASLGNTGRYQFGLTLGVSGNNSGDAGLVLRSGAAPATQPTFEVTSTVGNLTVLVTSFAAHGDVLDWVELLVYDTSTN